MSYSVTGHKANTASDTVVSYSVTGHKADFASDTVVSYTGQPLCHWSTIVPHSVTGHKTQLVTLLCQCHFFHNDII